jgi:hypothetical protein
MTAVVLAVWRPPHPTLYDNKIEGNVLNPNNKREEKREDKRLLAAI